MQYVSKQYQCCYSSVPYLLILQWNASEYEELRSQIIVLLCKSWRTILLMNLLIDSIEITFRIWTTEFVDNKKWEIQSSRVFVCQTSFSYAKFICHRYSNGIERQTKKKANKYKCTFDAMHKLMTHTCLLTGYVVISWITACIYKHTMA